MTGTSVRKGGKSAECYCAKQTIHYKKHTARIRVYNLINKQKKDEIRTN